MKSEANDRAARRIAWLRENRRVFYRHCGDVVQCHPLVLDLVCMRPGDRIATVEDAERVEASHRANSIMRRLIDRAQCSAKEASQC